MVKLRHYDNYGTVRFLTFSCYRRYKLFDRDHIFRSFQKHLDRYCQNHEIDLLGYVIMPNHVHLVLFPRMTIDIGRWIGELKAAFAYEIIAKLKKSDPSRLNRLRVVRGSKLKYAFWQIRCYDHNCRNPETIREKINYCHMNPVRAGLVSAPEEWLWSSYRWYQGFRDGIVQIEELDDLV